LGIKFGKYVNPADWLIKLANDPQSVNPDLTLQKLVGQNEQGYRHMSQIEKTTMFQTNLVSKNFIKKSQERSVSFAR
jgi:hypothetical protein